MSELEQRARELLAAEVRDECAKILIRNSSSDNAVVGFDAAIRAVIAALTEANRIGPTVDAERLVRLAERWERIAEENGVAQFTGNAHGLFANELRAALQVAAAAAQKGDAE